MDPVYNIKFVQNQVTQLAGAGVSIGDNSMTLTSFSQIDGTPLTMANFGIKGYGTVQPSEGTYEEQISWTGIVANGDGTVTLTGISTVFDVFPYTETLNFSQDHAGGTNFCVSNTAGFYNTFANKNDIGTVMATWTFSALGNGANPKIDDVRYVPEATDYVVKSYVDAAIANAGGSKVDVVNVNSATSGNSQVTTLSYPLVFSGVNRAAVIQISTEQLATVSSVTIGGTLAIQQKSVVDTPNNLRSEIWTLVAPAIGSQTVLITLSQSAYISSGGEALVNVDQATPIGATSSTFGDSDSPLVAVTTSYDASTVFDSISTANAPITMTVGPAQLNNWQQLTGTRQGASSLQAAGMEPDTIDMSYLFSRVTNWVYAAIEIKPVTPTFVSDHKVLVDGTDTTAGYLSDKIVAGSNITLAILNPGADEKIQITANEGGGGSGGLGISTDIVLGHNSALEFYTAYDSVSGRYYTNADPSSGGSVLIGTFLIYKQNSFGSWILEKTVTIPSVSSPFTGGVNSFGFATDGTYLYVLTEYRTGTQTSTNEIVRFATDGTSGVATTIQASHNTVTSPTGWSCIKTGPGSTSYAAFFIQSSILYVNPFYLSSGNFNNHSQIIPFTISGTTYTAGTNFTGFGGLGLAAAYDGTFFYNNQSPTTIGKYSVSGTVLTFVSVTVYPSIQRGCAIDLNSSAIFDGPDVINGMSVDPIAGSITFYYSNIYQSTQSGTGTGESFTKLLRSDTFDIPS